MIYSSRVRVKINEWYKYIRMFAIPDSEILKARMRKLNWSILMHVMHYNVNVIHIVWVAVLVYCFCLLRKYTKESETQFKLRIYPRIKNMQTKKARV